MSRRRSDQQWAGDIVEAIDAVYAARTLIDGLESVGAGALYLDAVTYRLMSIGEAAKNVSEEARGRHPEIPWRAVAGMRDLLAHHYHRRDPEVIIATVDNSLGSLRAAAVAIRDDES